MCVAIRPSALTYPQVSIASVKLKKTEIKTQSKAKSIKITDTMLQSALKAVLAPFLFERDKINEKVGKNFQDLDKILITFILLLRTEFISRNKAADEFAVPSLGFSSK